MEVYMRDLFLPDNLLLREDGSVYARNYMENVVPLEGESLLAFNERYQKEYFKLDYNQRNRIIPESQMKNLYKVVIFGNPTKLNKKEEDSFLGPQLMHIRVFLERENALNWAANKIKQLSIGYYYSDKNPNKRQYQFTYHLLKGNEELCSESAINGKII